MDEGTRRQRWAVIVLMVAALAAGVLLRHLYGGSGGRQTGALRFIMHPQPKQMATIAFLDADAGLMQLDDLRGKVLLLNIWATWCAPCREEMPSLDRLQAKLGGSNFEVIALSIDMDAKGLAAVKTFYSQVGIRHLRIYRDPTATAGFKLGSAGVPTTLLVDRHGRELGRLTGAAEWDSADAMNLLRRTLSP